MIISSIGSFDLLDQTGRFEVGFRIKVYNNIQKLTLKSYIGHFESRFILHKLQRLTEPSMYQTAPVQTKTYCIAGTMNSDI